MRDDGLIVKDGTSPHFSFECGTTSQVRARYPARMFRTLRAPLLAVALLAGAPATAAEPELALRLGVARAVGSAVANVPISDTVPLQFPIQLDALTREGPFAFGAYGSWSPALAGKCADASCSAWVARLGFQATWTFTTQGGSEPWIGLATGYEWARENRKRGGTVTTTWSGFEPIAIQGGVEWRVAPWLALGPYGLVGAGRYASYSVDTGYEEADTAIPEKAFHVWLHLGVRGRVAFGGTP